MGMKNKVLLVEPFKQGLIETNEGNEFKVLDSELYEFEVPEENYRNFEQGDVIIVEEMNVIKTMVQGKERFYVREEHVLEVLNAAKNGN